MTSPHYAPIPVNFSDRKHRIQFFWTLRCCSLGSMPLQLRFSHIWAQRGLRTKQDIRKPIITILAAEILGVPGDTGDCIGRYATDSFHPVEDGCGLNLTTITKRISTTVIISIMHQFTMGEMKSKTRPHFLLLKVKAILIFSLVGGLRFVPNFPEICLLSLLEKRWGFLITPPTEFPPAIKDQFWTSFEQTSDNWPNWAWQ